MPRRRSDEEPFEDYYEWDGYLTSGQAQGIPLPFNLLDEEADEVIAELKAKEAKRIPPGFQIPDKPKRKRRSRTSPAKKNR